MIRSVALLFLVAWAAPAGAGQPQPDSSLRRVRVGLASAGPLRTAAARRDGQGRPVFRVRIEEWQPRERRLVWDPANDTVVPSRVRPLYPGPHYEALSAMTPVEFRSSVNPGGADLLGPGQSVYQSIRAAMRRRQEAQTRRRIKEELAMLKRQAGS